ncbi:MAG: hypothetical protein QNK31_14210 [Porticoccus sp.]|nr:hypothetical protein [Porticoccus sp.]
MNGIISKGIWLCILFIAGCSTPIEDSGVSKGVFQVNEKLNGIETSHSVIHGSLRNAIYRVTEDEKAVDGGGNGVLGMYLFVNDNGQQNCDRQLQEIEHQHSVMGRYDESRKVIRDVEMSNGCYLLVMLGWDMPKISKDSQPVIVWGGPMKPARKNQIGSLASQETPYINQNVTGSKNLLTTGRTIQL